MCKCGGMPQDFEIFERGRDKPCVVVLLPRLQSKDASVRKSGQCVAAMGKDDEI